MQSEAALLLVTSWVGYIAAGNGAKPCCALHLQNKHSLTACYVTPLQISIPQVVHRLQPYGECMQQWAFRLGPYVASGAHACMPDRRTRSSASSHLASGGSFCHIRRCHATCGSQALGLASSTMRAAQAAEGVGRTDRSKRAEHCGGGNPNRKKPAASQGCSCPQRLLQCSVGVCCPA